MELAPKQDKKNIRDEIYRLLRAVRIAILLEQNIVKRKEQIMAGKPNIRSIRFSNELAELIDRQVGQSFTEKFENLITRCVWELPEKERQLEHIQEQINQERERLRSLQQATEELRMLERDIKSAQRYFAIVERRAKLIAEAAEKDGL